MRGLTPRPSAGNRLGLSIHALPVRGLTLQPSAGNRLGLNIHALAVRGLAPRPSAGNRLGLNIHALPVRGLTPQPDDASSYRLVRRACSSVADVTGIMMPRHLTDTRHSICPNTGR